MRILLSVAVAVLALGVSGAFAQDAKVDQGKKVYAAAAPKCTMCHSIAGVGNVKGPLDGVGKKYSAADMKLWFTDPKTITAKTKAARKPPMPAYAKLSAEDLDAVVAYMMSLK